MFFAVIFLAFIQWMFCQCKFVPAKLIPLMIPAALSVSYFVRESQRTELVCGMGAAIMGMILTIFFAGIALGWILYGLQIMRKNKRRDEG